MANATKNHIDDLFNFMQCMKHRMQITQERWEYDLTTNSVKFVQQTTSPLSEVDKSVCN